MGQIRRFLIFFSILLLTVSAILSSAEQNLRFYAFANPNCQSCVEDLQILRNLYGDRVVAYNLTEDDVVQRCSAIVSLINLTEPLKPPLVGIFKNERLAAVVLGFHSENDWKIIVNAEYNGVPIYSTPLYDISQGTIIPNNIIEDQNVTISIAKLFSNETIDGKNYIPKDFFILLPLIATAAAVDAINPCEFYVLTVFLSFVYFRSGRKTLLKAGIAFSIAVFVIYYLFGLGLLEFISYVQEARLLVVILGFSVGIRAVLSFIFGVFGLSIGLRETVGSFLNKRLKRVPDLFSKRLSSYLRTESESPTTAFLIGVVTSIFLLPCTSGPYFIATSLITDLKYQLEGTLLLGIYNGIIVAPFIAITVCLYTLRLKTSELKRWSSQNQKWLNLTAGLLMILLSIYLLSTITR